MKSRSGFTLIEVLVAMLVTAVILGGAYSVFTSQQKQTVNQTAVSDMQQILRSAMDYIARDIRMAGYDPKGTGKFGITDIKFRSLADNPSPSGHSFIRFSWDKNEDGVLDSRETIDYGLVDNGTITPGISDLYLRLPNDTNTRDVLASNIIALGFAYAYDGDGDGELDKDGSGNIVWAVDSDNDGDWDSLTLATGVTAETGVSVDTETIRAVRIWMLAQSQAPDRNYTDTNTYIVGPHSVAPNDHFRHRLFERTVLCRNMGIGL